MLKNLKYKKKKKKETNHCDPSFDLLVLKK